MSSDLGMSSATDGGPASPDAGEQQGFFSRAGGKIFLIWLVLTAIGVVLGLFAPKHLFPEMLSKQGDTALSTVVVFTVLAAPVAGLIYAIAAYSLFAWRQWGGQGSSPPEDGPPLRGNTPLTISWLVVTSLLCIVLLVWGLTALASDERTAPNALQVDVTGQQWLWTFRYPGTGVQSRDLVLPVNRAVEFDVTSLDVTHGFFALSLGVQVDANPGEVTTLDATPNKLGKFVIRCSQLCGLYHAFMYASGAVVTPAQFEQWLQSQGASAASGEQDAEVHPAARSGGGSVEEG